MFILATTNSDQVIGMVGWTCITRKNCGSGNSQDHFHFRFSAVFLFYCAIWSHEPPRWIKLLCLANWRHYEQSSAGSTATSMVAVQWLKMPVV